MRDKDTKILEERYGDVVNHKSKGSWLDTVGRLAHNSMFDDNIRIKPEFGSVDITVRDPVIPSISLGMSLSPKEWDVIDLSKYYETNDIDGAIKEIHDRIRKLAVNPEFQMAHKSHEDSLKNIKHWD